MGESDLPRVLQLLWGRTEPRRGPKPGRTISDIAEAAVRLADRDGLSGVSMSAVAQEVGLTTMALYRYLDSKQDLFVAMADAAYGPPPKRRPSGDWRAQLQAWARANRAALGHHPWIVQIPISEPPLAPNQLRWMERGLSAFAGTPLSEQQKLSSLLLVEVYVRGQVLLSGPLQDAISAGPLTAEDANARYVRRLADLIGDGSFPSITAALQSGSLQDSDDFAVEEFRFGLDTVLDGIEARITRLSRRPRVSRQE